MNLLTSVWSHDALDGLDRTRLTGEIVVARGELSAATISHYYTVWRYETLATARGFMQLSPTVERRAERDRN